MDQVWWTQVTNARRFIHSVSKFINSGKSLILTLPENVPWYDVLIEEIQMEVEKETSQKAFDIFTSPEQNIGKFMLAKYCKWEKQMQYRPSRTYARFLAESDDIVLNDRYVWVKNIPVSVYSEWVTFVEDYNQNLSQNHGHAVFILEFQEDDIKHISTKGILNLSYSREVTALDAYIFCFLLISETRYEDSLKPYLAELVFRVCGTDVELCARCLSNSERFLRRPFSTFKKIVQESVRSNGRPFGQMPDEEVINKRIWEAQIKIIFPLIEQYREDLVKKFYSDIQAHLPVENGNGEMIDEASELEIGTLWYMAANYKFMSTQEYERLGHFRQARNDLAHLRILEAETVKTLLNNKPIF